MRRPGKNGWWGEKQMVENSAFKRLGARHVSANKNPKGFLFLKPLPPEK
jgi:hypothetical protein